MRKRERKTFLKAALEEVCFQTMAFNDEKK